ncbi:MAG: hypothetical protein NTX16_03085 [Actinobacteria bacterium]|nr:hypothetical protein [Actinomycetota bacterium]
MVVAVGVAVGVVVGLGGAEGVAVAVTVAMGVGDDEPPGPPQAARPAVAAIAVTRHKTAHIGSALL